MLISLNSVVGCRVELMLQICWRVGVDILELGGGMSCGTDGADLLEGWC